MPAGIGVGQLVGLVREVRGSEGAAPRVAISGPRAAELAQALAAGGDAAAVVVTEAAVGQAVTVRLVEGDVSQDERGLLRQLAREEAPVVVVRRGGSSRIPHVLADGVVECDELDIEAIASAIARAAGADGPPLGGRLPVLRPAVSDRVISMTAVANAALAASSRVAQPQLPLLALAQARMLLLLGVARGETLPRDPQALALAAGPAFVAAIGTGLGSRTVVRRLPLGGPVVRAAVAYGATRFLGRAVLRREGGLSVRTGS